MQLTMSSAYATMSMCACLNEQQSVYLVSVLSVKKADMLSYTMLFRAMLADNALRKWMENVSIRLHAIRPLHKDIFTWRHSNFVKCPIFCASAIRNKMDFPFRIYH